MDLLDLIVLLLFAGGGWLWYDSLNAREKAIAAAKSSCAADDLLLLDATVAIAQLGVGRDDDGVLRLRRVYDFEYSDSGDDRHAGNVVMLGSRVLVINVGARGNAQRALPR